MQRELRARSTAASSEAASSEAAAHGCDENGLPPEEQLRLDDGTPLPAELAELRSLLTIQAGLAREVAEGGAEGGDSSLAALRAGQSAQLRECLLDYDDSVLFLHDLVIDHDRLCKRLAALRRRRTVVPAGRSQFDESFDADGVPDDTPSDWRDWLGDEPWLELRGGAANGHAAGPAPAPAEEEEEEDEEALDQRVCASRNHIKQLLRARGCP